MKQLLTALLLLLGATHEASGFPFDHLRTTDDVGPNKIPRTGTSRILVVPSRVGVSEFPPNRWAELVQIFRPEGGEGTFRRYWQIVSNGKYDPIPTLANPVLFPSSCPVPDLPVPQCHITATPEGVAALINGSVSVGIKKILERVRDEQGIQLAQFDTNSGSGQQPDGYFDGVIFDSDIYQAIALPLAAVKTELAIPASSPTDPQLIKLGILALVPPEHHEFAHTFGLIDLYGGPTVNDLLGPSDGTPGAFTRQQLGWTQVLRVTGPGTHVLRPTLEGGAILRIGDWGKRYLLLENRGGKHHNQLGSDGLAGLYLYSVDESTLPDWDLGFLDPGSKSFIYLPNAKPPYLSVNLPLKCTLGPGASPCALKDVGVERRLQHVMGEDAGLSVRIDSISSEGEISLTIKAAPPLDSGPDPEAGSIDARLRRDGRRDGAATSVESGCGCGAAPAGGSIPALALLSMLLVALARPGRRGR